MKFFTWRVVLFLFAVAALAYAWLAPHYSTEDKAYYAAVFCAIHADDPATWPARMENAIEGSNNDYALQKRHYNASLGREVIKTWQGMNGATRDALAAAPQTCDDELARAMR
ncbi:hypothetical protein VG539_002814 [Cronobacter muytjensii]|uniref:hypothetical protein n=1 Tax=Cronobacter muytjensii TaxID=413501 RepID=UPI0002840183|nr:hypothetical protein [Cronobacter muytjensii]MDI6456810.1 hypothetical protein [Cronobacter muytjensii]